MSMDELGLLLQKRYRPIVSVIVALVGGVWLLIAGIGQFTRMVDERAQAVFDKVSAKPFAEHHEFETRLGQHDKEIAALIANQTLLDKNLTRLMALQDAIRGDIPVRTSGISR